MTFFEQLYYYFQHPLAIYLDFFYGKTTLQVYATLLFDFWLWIPLFIFSFKYIFLPLWLHTRQTKYGKTIRFILLAIDVPKKNEQSVYAMEQVFAQIQGAHGTFNFVEKWWQGMGQLSMTLEIVSIDGYIQLIMRIPDSWRDIVEGAIYGQFPDAEITEIEDYTKTVPSVYPNDTHDMWGVEWTFDNSKNPYMPFKTYLEFEDKFNQKFIDPMGGLLEAMGKIGKGEQIWLHMRITPLEVPWSKAGEDLYFSLLGREKKKEKGFLEGIGSIPTTLFNDITEQIFTVRPLPEDAPGEKKQEDMFGKLWKMSPGEQDALKAMERKMGKLGYNVKMRYGYFAEHAVVNKPAGVNAIIGAMKQFNAIGRQGFKPALKQTGTKASYFRVKQRKAYRQRIMTAALKSRDGDRGMSPMKWCTEELATIFHFPSMEIKTPMLKKTDLVKAEAPVNLPFEDQQVIQEKVVGNEQLLELPWETPQKQTTDPQEKIESGLPFVAHAESPVVLEQPQESTGYTFDYDNDYFEERFAVDKEAFKKSRPVRDELLKRIEREEDAKKEIASAFPPEHVEKKSVDVESLRKEVIQKQHSTKPSFEEMYQQQAQEYTTEVIDFHKGVFAEKEKKKASESSEDEIPPNLPFIS